MNRLLHHKYLKQFSEPQARVIAQKIIDDAPNKPYEFTLTIPAYKESSAFFTRLKNTLLKAHRVLLIIVINQPDNSPSPIDDTNINQQLWDDIHQQCGGCYRQKNHCLLHLESSDVLLVDRFNQEQAIPHKQGVGLARKIACDIACYLVANGIIKQPWIYTTDADTHLPANYFLALQGQQHSAAVYRFKHQGNDSALSHATHEYEKALRYYVDGLRWAGSGYAFHTIGSCIAINTYAYMQARGYPKRAGGEDFYLLNKLAKLGDILQIDHCELIIDARLSNRVPFGTGPAVEKILQNQHFDYYNPKVFIALKTILVANETLFHHKHSSQQWLIQFNEPQQVALKSIGIDKFFSHLSKQIKTPEQCQHHWQDWFDAFKTLKLIHALEAYYPKLPLTQAIDGFAELQASTD